tara:strand:+ start:32 stop:937 length:906 start_codon:yes stop_codon:yes gene_type:complete
LIDGLKEEEGNGSNANGSTGSKPNCPLCRSDRDVHWEMSYVPSGCDDDDDLDMLQDSDSNEDEEEEDDQESNTMNERSDIISESPQPPAKRQKRASSKQTSKTVSKKNVKKATKKTSHKSVKKSAKKSAKKKNNSDDQDEVVKRLEREVAEYKTKMREVCDSADQRFKEEKRLRKDWNKAQAQMQARASDAEERFVSLEKQYGRLIKGGDEHCSLDELTQCGHVLIEAMKGNMHYKDVQASCGSEVECVICMSETATNAMVPCGHLALCSSCAAGMKAANKKHRCPMCKSEIQSFLKIFKP